MTEAEQDAALLALFAGFDQETNDRDMAAARAAEAARIAAWHKDYAAIPEATYRIIGGCGRCGGKGWISAFKHIKGGECFACGGQG